VLWKHLYAPYLSRACILVDSNLVVAHEVLGVVDVLLMNPANFHVVDLSLLSIGRSD
jgi:Na+-transporting NADH:ubiquinone oxidoreductase subunit NqrB